MGKTIHDERSLTDSPELSVRTYCILVIDDDENLLTIFEMALESAFTVILCRTTNHALIEIRNFRPTVILVDPSGVEESFYRSEEVLRIPCIACSIDKPSSDSANKFIGFIRRPFDPLKLSEKIMSLLSQRELL